MVDALGAKAGLEVTPHGLRHTAATTLLNKTNGNVRAVSEFLGHKGLGIVQQYDDDRQKQAKKMGALLDDDPEDT
jgi:integrase